MAATHTAHSTVMLLWKKAWQMPCIYAMYLCPQSSAKECHYCSREEEAVAVFTLLHDRYIAAPHQMIRAWLPLSHKVGSAKMIKVRKRKRE